MDEVADAGAVSGGPLDTRDGEGGVLHPGVDHLAEHVGGVFDLLAGTQLGIRADRVEVPQAECLEVGGVGGVTQDVLHHELGGGVRAAGVQRGVLGHLELVVGGVDRRRGGKQDPVDVVALHALQQLDRLADVVLVVAQRVGDRLRDDDLGRAVHDGVDALLGEDAIEQVLIGDVALVEGAVADEFASSRRQVVQNDDLVARFLTGRGHRRPDVAGSAGDENPHESSELLVMDTMLCGAMQGHVHRWP